MESVVSASPASIRPSFGDCSLFCFGESPFPIGQSLASDGTPPSARQRMSKWPKVCQSDALSLEFESWAKWCEDWKQSRSMPKMYLKAGVSRLWFWTKSSPMAILIKFYWNTDKIIYLLVVYDFHATMTNLSSYVRDYPTKSKIFTIWTFAVKFC